MSRPVRISNLTADDRAARLFRHLPVELELPPRVGHDVAAARAPRQRHAEKHEEEGDGKHAVSGSSGAHRRRRVVGDQRADDRREFRRVDGFGEIALKAGGEHPPLVFRARERGQRDGWHAR